MSAEFWPTFGVSYSVRPKLAHVFLSRTHAVCGVPVRRMRSDREAALATCPSCAAQVRAQPEREGEGR